MKKSFLSKAIHDLYRKALKHTKYRWVVVFGTLLYLVSPLDISPDVFPVLGWIDDGIVVSLLITEMSQLMTEQLKQKRKDSTDSDIETQQTITVDAVSVG